MKKTLLFLVSVIGLSISLSSQTNGWYQYTMLQNVNQMVKDAANNLHIATNMGYIKYNTGTNMVETFFNLTSQSPGVGSCHSVAVNPVNGNVALGYPLWMGIAISNGSTITEYHVANSNLDSSFQTPELYFAQDGTLYIYERGNSKYQTFKNGVFSAVKSMGTSVYAIVENNAGTKVYFATSTGLWELVKATGVFTNFSTSNSDLLDDRVNALFEDANDVLHIGSNAGLNTMTSAGVWGSFQKQVGTTNTFFAVFGIDKNTQGDVLVNNSSGINTNTSGQTTHDGYSIINTTANTWTNYGSSTFCNNDNYIMHILFIADTLFANFANNSQGHHNLWSFAPGGGGCTEHDLNYQGIDRFGSSGMYDVTVRNNPTDNTKLDIAFVNGTYYSWILKSMTIPKAFTGTFPALTTQFTNTNNDKQPLKTLTRVGSTVLASERDGIWFINDDNSSTFIPHNITDFKVDAIKKIATRNTGTGATDNKVTLAIDGLDSNYNRRVYRSECDIDTQTCDAYTELFTTRDLGSDITYECTDALYPNEMSCDAVITEATTFNKIFTVESWSFANPVPVVKFSDDVTALNPSSFSPVYFLDTDNPNLDGTDPYNPQACFSENIYDDWQNSQQCRKTDGTYETKKFDIDNNGTGNDVIERVFEFYKYANLDRPEDFFKAIINIYKINAFAGGSGNKILRKKFDEYFLNNGSSGGRNTQIAAFQDNELTDTQITLPIDFTLKSKVINYVYSNTNMAIVLNSNYGLLIKPAVDYTSLTLGLKDEVLSKSLVKLYPNPATNTVSITGSDIKKVEVYDINGRLVLSTQQAAFSVKNLAQGIYIVRATTANKGVVSKKLIKN